MNNFEVNVGEMFEQFKQLTFKQMDSVIKGAMRAAANEIKNETISNARAGIKSYNNHPDDPYNGDSILDAPRVTKLEDRYDGELSIKVHVMGSNKSNSQTYRFRFLEAGTKDRSYRTRNGNIHNTGRISPRRFFDRARRGVNIENIYLERISRAIDKVNNETT